MTSAGAFYGGARGDRSDDGTTLNPASAVGAEHIQFVRINNNTSVTGVDSAFSFNVVTSTRDGDDDGSNPRSVQGSLRQFIQNADAVAGANAMRFVPAVATNASGSGGNWWKITVATSALPTITDAGTTIDGTAYYNTTGVWGPAGTMCATPTLVRSAPAGP